MVTSWQDDDIDDCKEGLGARNQASNLIADTASVRADNEAQTHATSVVAAESESKLIC